jgi:phage FluMu protein Com
MLPASIDAQKLLDQQIDAEINSELAPTVLGRDYKGRRKPYQVAELATILSGLQPEQEQLIWCKYLSDSASCRKGLNSYRAIIYKDRDLISWVYAHRECNPTEKLTEKCQRLIDTRTSVSAILSGSAYTDMISSFRCDVCNGVGATVVGGLEIKCDECRGQGHCGTRTSAQMRADKLHCSLSTYYRQYHKVFENHFWQRLVEIETRAIMHVQEQY